MSARPPEREHSGPLKGSAELPALDPEQEQLLAALRAAGHPLTYGELRRLGIENPASLCYELETAGYPVRRQERITAGGLTVAAGVALMAEPASPQAGSLQAPSAGEDAAKAAPPGEHPSAGKRTPPPEQSRPAKRTPAPASWQQPTVRHERVIPPPPADPSAPVRPQPPAEPVPAEGRVWRELLGSRGLALTAIILAGALAGGLAGVLTSGAPAHGHSASAARGAPTTARQAAHSTTPGSPEGRSARTDGRRNPAVARTATSTSTSSGAGGSGAGAAPASALQHEGSTLLESGSYSAAAEKLRAAIAASGQSTAGCAQAQSESCLTYAYALFDLGRALEGEHDYSAAVPIYEQRLQIADQREAVAQALARARAHLAPATTPAPHHSAKPPRALAKPKRAPAPPRPRRHHRRPQPPAASGETQTTQSSSETATGGTSSSGSAGSPEEGLSQGAQTSSP